MLPNYTPQDWLQIGLSAAFGKDKLSFTERLKWIEATSFDTDPYEAEEPAYALAMLDGLSGNRQVRVHLDATSSGTQILAAFANCRKSGTHCNLFGEARQDAYTNAWKAMGMTDTIPRSDVKRAFMTAAFGSRKVPREALGEQNLPAFYEMYQREFPGVWAVLNYIQGLWQSEVHSHRWTMPDGFEVIQWNNGLEEQTVSLFGQEVTVRKQVHTQERRGIALAANITHSCDALICREMVKRAQFDPQEAKDTIEFGFEALTEPHPEVEGLLALYRKTQFLSVDLIRYMDSETYYEDLTEAEMLEIQMLLEHLANKQQFYLVPVH